jgi:hypothetical protein
MAELLRIMKKLFRVIDMNQGMGRPHDSSA